VLGRNQIRVHKFGSVPVFRKGTSIDRKTPLPVHWCARFRWQLPADARCSTGHEAEVMAKNSLCSFCVEGLSLCQLGLCAEDGLCMC
jgi:hypothetical protein